jgi:intracellular septation protein
MKFLFDVFPVVLFFAAYQLGKVYAGANAAIYVATGVAIAASVCQVGWQLVRRKPVPPMVWASFGIITVFGGLTIALQDETFIKWKPTLLYWLFAAVLGGSMLGFRKNLIQKALGPEISLPAWVWGRLNAVWVAFFCAMGLLNLYVAYNFSTDIWVNFKLFGGIGLMLLFVVAQSFFLARYVEDTKQ